ncbi:MAG: alcohol dehydrogenase, partial [Verrucomicrobia bacterium]
MPDRSILVTGVAGEIGGYLVDELLKDGWIVCGLDRRSPANVDRAEFSFQKCDLSDAADAEIKIEIFHERFGAFDAVVNCAGLIANS